EPPLEFVLFLFVVPPPPPSRLFSVPPSPSTTPSTPPLLEDGGGAEVFASVEVVPPLGELDVVALAGWVLPATAEAHGFCGAAAALEPVSPARAPKTPCGAPATAPTTFWAMAPGSGVTLGLASVPPTFTGTARLARVACFAFGSKRKLSRSLARSILPEPRMVAPLVSSTSALLLALPLAIPKSLTKQLRLEESPRPEKVMTPTRSARSSLAKRLLMRPGPMTNRVVPSSPAMMARTELPLPVTFKSRSALPPLRTSLTCKRCRSDPTSTCRDVTESATAGVGIPPSTSALIATFPPITPALSGSTTSRPSLMVRTAATLSSVTFSRTTLRPLKRTTPSAALRASSGSGSAGNTRPSEGLDEVVCPDPDLADPLVKSANSSRFEVKLASMLGRGPPNANEAVPARSLLPTV